MTRAASTPTGPGTGPSSRSTPEHPVELAASAPAHLEEPLGRFARALTGVDRLGVAYSGGVDSSVLLALALRLLGPDRVLAVTGVSASLAGRDHARARDQAEGLGVRMVEVRTREMDRADYRRNGVDRCYFCKDELFTVISAELVAEHGLDAVAYGENADDALRPDRPGSGAAAEHRVLRPLAEAGMDKRTVREVATWLGLPTAQTPASPCLASRIPHHQEVTPRKLAQVERAEDAVLALGIPEVRVRHHGDTARVEVPLAHLDTLLAAREPLTAQLLALGFAEVVLDPGGLQSGRFTLQELGLQHGQERAASDVGAGTGPGSAAR